MSLPVVVGSPRSKITSSGCASVGTLNPACFSCSNCSNVSEDIRKELELTLVTEILAGVTGELGSNVESLSPVLLEICIVGIVIKPL